MTVFRPAATAALADPPAPQAALSAAEQWEYYAALIPHNEDELIEQEGEERGYALTYYPALDARDEFLSTHDTKRKGSGLAVVAFVAAYGIDVLLLRSALEYFLTPNIGEAGASVAVYVLPLLIAVAEVWIGKEALRAAAEQGRRTTEANRLAQLAPRERVQAAQGGPGDRIAGWLPVLLPLALTTFVGYAFLTTAPDQFGLFFTLLPIVLAFVAHFMTVRNSQALLDTARLWADRRRLAALEGTLRSETAKLNGLYGRVNQRVTAMARLQTLTQGAYQRVPEAERGTLLPPPAQDGRVPMMALPDGTLAMVWRSFGRPVLGCPFGCQPGQPERHTRPALPRPDAAALADGNGGPGTPGAAGAGPGAPAADTEAGPQPGTPGQDAAADGPAANGVGAPGHGPAQPAHDDAADEEGDDDLQGRIDLLRRAVRRDQRQADEEL